MTIPKHTYAERQRATSCEAMAVDQSCQTKNSSFSHAIDSSAIPEEVVGL